MVQATRTFPPPPADVPGPDYIEYWKSHFEKIGAQLAIDREKIVLDAIEKSCPRCGALQGQTHRDGCARLEKLRPKRGWWVRLRDWFVHWRFHRGEFCRLPECPRCAKGVAHV